MILKKRNLISKGKAIERLLIKLLRKPSNTIEFIIAIYICIKYASVAKVVHGRTVLYRLFKTAIARLVRLFWVSRAARDIL